MTAPRDIIVIGVSLGGVEALTAITSGLHAGLQASIIVVMHTSAKSPRLLADIVKRATTLKVSYADNNELFERGHLYFAPPSQHLKVMASGQLKLDDGPSEHFHRPAADVLFRSAAEAFGSRVIGVVLTGGDGDGTAGLNAIHAAGGVGVVQEPSDARDPSMPLSALRGDHPSFRATLELMPALLIRLVSGSAADTLSVSPCRSIRAAE